MAIQNTASATVIRKITDWSIETQEPIIIRPPENITVDQNDTALTIGEVTTRTPIYTTYEAPKFYTPTTQQDFLELSQEEVRKNESIAPAKNKVDFIMRKDDDHILYNKKM